MFKSSPHLGFGRCLSFFCATVVLFFTFPARPAEKTPVTPQYFEKSIRPILQEYCLKCHSTEKQKGDIDLESFAKVEDIKKQPKIWQSVAEQLAEREMPPKEKPQPAAADREKLAGWTAEVLDTIA